MRLLCLSLLVAALWAEQPIPYSHKKHVAMGLECKGCHTMPGKGEAATFRAPARNGDRRQAVLDELARLARTSGADIRRENRLYEDLGLDSLQAIELLLFLDHDLGVPLDDETAERIRTVGQLLDEVQERTARPELPRRRPAPIRSALPHEERPALDRALSGSFRAGIRAGYSPIRAPLRAYLIEIGRRKLVVPLYEELAKKPADKEWALAVYREARPGYHPVTQHTVDQKLGLAK